MLIQSCEDQFTKWDDHRQSRVHLSRYLISFIHILSLKLSILWIEVNIKQRPKSQLWSCWVRILLSVSSVWLLKLGNDDWRIGVFFFKKNFLILWRNGLLLFISSACPISFNQGFLSAHLFHSFIHFTVLISVVCRVEMTSSSLSLFLLCEFCI